MSDRPPLYRPLASHLPGFYREDTESWSEICGFLGLLDDLFRGYLDTLDELPVWLSPYARQARVPGTAPDTAAARVRDRYRSALDSVAGWFDFCPPAGWSQDDDPEAELDRRREFLLRVARLWRRRGTPRGFVDLFSVRFGLEEAEARPVLLEHFRYRPASAYDDDAGDGGAEDPYALRVSLLVPVTATFREHRVRKEAVQFVARHAPAHLLTRVCWVPDDFALDLSSPDEVRDVLGHLGSFVPHPDGIHLVAEETGARVLDRLDAGRLPGGGDPTDAESDE